MMVAQFAEDLWIAEGEIVNFYGFAYPTRSVIIRLADGSLWVWSPVRLTGDLKDEVLKLGQPAHFVSPNKIHHLFLSAWHEAFPEAKLWGPRSTVGKRIDLHHFLQYIPAPHDIVCCEITFQVKSGDTVVCGLVNLGPAWHS